ncbi:MAG TPA: FAD-dependent oxidoreductase, partial [Anaerolineaceae bacterium]|nr:FAD-dependent oxidoreductase [Anaerolineaceae bacterium]
MKKLLILGAGTAGTMAANRLNRLLNMDEWQITLIDPDPVHYYQPDYIFIPFGIVTAKSAVKNKRDYLPPTVKLIQAKVEMIEPELKQVILSIGNTLTYDFLIIATGTDIHPEETP